MNRVIELTLSGLLVNMRSDGGGGPVLMLTVVEPVQRAMHSGSHIADFKHKTLPNPI